MLGKGRGSRKHRLAPRWALPDLPALLCGGSAVPGLKDNSEQGTTPCQDTSNQIPPESSMRTQGAAQGEAAAARQRRSQGPLHGSSLAARAELLSLSLSRRGVQSCHCHLLLPPSLLQPLRGCSQPPLCTSESGKLRPIPPSGKLSPPSSLFDCSLARWLPHTHLVLQSTRARAAAGSGRGVINSYGLTGAAASSV